MSLPPDRLFVARGQAAHNPDQARNDQPVADKVSPAAARRRCDCVGPNGQKHAETRHDQSRHHAPVDKRRAAAHGHFTLGARPSHRGDRWRRWRCNAASRRLKLGSTRRALNASPDQFIPNTQTLTTTRAGGCQRHKSLPLLKVKQRDSCPATQISRGGRKILKWVDRSDYA